MIDLYFRDSVAAGLEAPMVARIVAEEGAGVILRVVESAVVGIMAATTHEEATLEVKTARTVGVVEDAVSSILLPSISIRDGY